MVGGKDLTMLRTLRRILAAALAPFVLVWDGTRWIARQLWPAAFPGANLDPVDTAEEAVAQLRDSLPAVPADASVEHPLARTCIAYSRYHLSRDDAAYPANAADLPNRLEAWLATLTPDEHLTLSRALPYVVDRHINARVCGDWILGLRPVPSEEQAADWIATWEAEAADKAARAAEAKEDEQAYMAEIFADLMEPEPTPVLAA
jgi:hypothetical protein